MSKITVELTPEEALLVHDAMKRNKTREFARGGYYGAREFKGYEQDPDAPNGRRPVYQPRDADRAAGHRALGEQHKTICERILAALKAAGC